MFGIFMTEGRFLFWVMGFFDYPFWFVPCIFLGTGPWNNCMPRYDRAWRIYIYTSRYIKIRFMTFQQVVQEEYAKDT